ncbi:MAG TPA: hypothetical protein PKH65_01395 [Bacteroidia bacterium]|nr:hypothetical protein [Bacteroidia bacterium]HNT79309.1 hypothetical protein [Bacteroidia bacterium]
MAQELKSFAQTYKPYVLFETNNSFSRDKGVNMQGLSVGFSPIEHLRVGIGYYWLSSDIIDTRVVSSDTLKAELSMRQFALRAEPLIYKYEAWQVSSPLHIGIGNSYYDDRNPDNGIGKIDKQTNYMIQPMLVVQYKILKWVGLSIGSGYRFNIAGDKQRKDTFSSGIYALGIKIFPEEIFRSAKADQ